MSYESEDIIAVLLSDIELHRRPFYKIWLSNLEGRAGSIFYRKSPPINFSESKNYLNLGCGDCHFPEWVNADYYRFSDLLRKNRGLPDWMLDASQPWKCEDNYWDGIYTEHTLEHLNYAQAVVAFREIYRTLKRGSWFRLVLPGLQQCLDSSVFIHDAISIASLTQTHGHVSVWDAGLAISMLSEVGFEIVHEVAFGQGACPKEMIKDLESRRNESFYVEAKKE